MMKLLIKNEKGEEVYSRDVSEIELEKYLLCKDCKHFIQHYGRTEDCRYKDGELVIDHLGHVVANIYKINAGHCCAGTRIKSLKPDDRVCSKFELINL